MAMMYNPYDMSKAVRYSVELFKRIVRVSVESLAIVKLLPRLNERKEKGNA
jgi:hypothetical protein